MSKIAVINDHLVGLMGEQIFWAVLVNNIKDTVGIQFDDKKKMFSRNIDDVGLVIQNAFWGRLTDKPTISFLQDNYIEMNKLKMGNFEDNIKMQINALKDVVRVTNSNHMADTYKEYGDFRVIPVGVDDMLFKPMDKEEMRKKYRIPKDKIVKIWVGSHHPVKGFNLLKPKKEEFWILVFKDYSGPQGYNTRSYCRLDQKVLVELYNCADYCVMSSRMESEGLAPIEAMFCNVKVEVINKVGIFWDWMPENKNPRQEALDKGLDWQSMINSWEKLIGEVNGGA